MSVLMSPVMEVLQVSQSWWAISSRASQSRQCLAACHADFFLLFKFKRDDDDVRDSIQFPFLVLWMIIHSTWSSLSPLLKQINESEYEQHNNNHARIQETESDMHVLRARGVISRTVLESVGIRNQLDLEEWCQQSGHRHVSFLSCRMKIMAFDPSPSSTVVFPSWWSKMVLSRSGWSWDNHDAARILGFISQSCRRRCSWCKACRLAAPCPRYMRSREKLDYMNPTSRQRRRVPSLLFLSGTIEPVREPKKSAWPWRWWWAQPFYAWHHGDHHQRAFFLLWIHWYPVIHYDLSWRKCGLWNISAERRKGRCGCA